MIRIHSQGVNSRRHDREQRGSDGHRPSDCAVGLRRCATDPWQAPFWTILTLKSGLFVCARGASHCCGALHIEVELVHAILQHRMAEQSAVGVTMRGCVIS